MIPASCKRLAEVDFPIAVVSKHAAREKESRRGHIPKLHVWPAARPTSSSRAMLLALLLPDPCDRQCPPEFIKTAQRLLRNVQGSIRETPDGIRQALLKFIGDYASWDLSSNESYLETARQLIKVCYTSDPVVIDPFSGGGCIPLEALRLGCDTLSSDLNPLATLIQKVVLNDIPRFGASNLSTEAKEIAEIIISGVTKQLNQFYPKDDDGSIPIAYLWARTVICESPGCGAEIPLMRSFWLSKKAKRKRAFNYYIERPAGEAPKVVFDIFTPGKDKEVPKSTVDRAKATCLACGTVLAPDRVRAQLRQERGGADVIFDEHGQRIGGARLLAVVLLKPGEKGRHYRLPTDKDYQAVRRAAEKLKEVVAKPLPNGLSPVPDEPTPIGGGSGASRAFSIHNYGVYKWGDIFTKRQILALHFFSQMISQLAEAHANDLIGLCFSKMVDMNNSLSTWQPHAEIPAHMLTRFAIPMKWDFSEAVPITESSGSLTTSLKRALQLFPNLAVIKKPGTVDVIDATNTPYLTDSANVWFTDPPYYDAIPYAGISDFFYVWLKRALPDHPLLHDPFDSSNPLTPKVQEALQDETQEVNERPKDKDFFEETMAKAFAEGRRVLTDDGIGSVVFAHKTTEGWEALLSGLTKGGWTITGSWPIATEMGSRLRARDSAALATSVHLVCRPRTTDEIGDWGQVLRELPNRVGDWMENLQSKGVRGADLVFACIGPALEIFSRYSKVETAEGREIKLPEYLKKVWEVVGRTALEQILGTAEAKARNSAAGTLEEDARLSALFLWTLQSTKGLANNNGEKAEEEAPTKKTRGYSLIFDIVRRFAQPLGIHLEEWKDRVIEIDKGVVRLIPVTERAKQLFGDVGAHVVADELERSPEDAQFTLFPGVEDAAVPKVKGRRRARAMVTDSDLTTTREATTLDRIHAAMLLQKSGRTNALRAMLKAEQDRSPDFLRLANALSALYPKGSEEKRLLDAMLLVVGR